MSTTAAPSWRARRDQAVALMTAVEAEGLDPEREARLEALAEDGKWEVRKELADRLLALPEDHLVRFAARLQADDNHFVAAAANRALERHRKGIQAQFRRRKGILEVQDQYESIERLHGEPAARKARRMAERLYDLTIGAGVHELRGLATPLLDWCGSLHAQLEAEGGCDQAALRRHLPRMHQRLVMLGQVLDDMREFSRATPPSRHPESLARLVDEAVAMARDWFAASGIDLAQVMLDVVVPPGIYLEVARHQVLMALRNVVKNAIESLAVDPQRLRPGTVHIIARTEDGLAVLEVTDNGMGLSPEELEDLRRFVPGGTSKKTHGTGFGLPIAHRKVQDHGGSLRIESAVEVGTTVTIVLPLEARAEEQLS